MSSPDPNNGIIGTILNSSVFWERLTYYGKPWTSSDRIRESLKWNPSFLASHQSIVNEIILVSKDLKDLHIPPLKYKLLCSSQMVQRTNPLTNSISLISFSGIKTSKNQRSSKVLSWKVNSLKEAIYLHICEI